MNKYDVTIKAKFASREDYWGNAPASVKFFYEADGKPLKPSHRTKIEKITAYMLEHGLYPVFVTEETITDDTKYFEAEALLNLNNWSNAGQPRFKIKDIRTGKPLNTPCCNTGVKPSPKAS